jgi:hypothetical protein
MTKKGALRHSFVLWWLTYLFQREKSYKALLGIPTDGAKLLVQFLVTVRTGLGDP